MSLIDLIVVLVVLGAILVIVSLLKIDATVKQIIYIVVTVAIFIYLLKEWLAPALNLK
ncbi:MAG TPA: hypothetical protein VF944_09365 [Candidatus Bathyarchaeia archaeon]